MQDIGAIIKDKRHNVAKLHKTLEDLKFKLSLEEDELKILESAIKILGGEVENKVDNTQDLRFADNVDQNTLTNAELVEVILNEYGKSLHIKDIHREIVNRFSKDTTAASINVMITKRIKKNRTFYKSAPSTYGLLSWYRQSKNDSEVLKMNRRKESP